MSQEFFHGFLLTHSNYKLCHGAQPVTMARLADSSHCGVIWS